MNKKEQKLLATWAADCAERVLPFFEKPFPKDNRPRKAIEACREWVSTGVFSMRVIRKASLEAHAAARDAKENEAACFAARAAGQAVATAHVSEHAFGAAYYSLKIVALNNKNTKVKLVEELDWQTKQLPQKLRKSWKDWQAKRLPKNLKKLVHD